jgi:glycosyltransferase involved in cell wall biosynthesis
MKCSVIIRAFNEEKFIGKLMHGIKEQTTSFDVEIVLVDSGSTDRTVEIAQEYGAIIVSIKPEDFSFGYALNVGCQRSSGDILVFASAHVYPVYKDWLETLVKHFDRSEVELVYGRQVGDETSRFAERRLLERWFPNVSDFNQSHSFCNNANCAVRREAWLKNKYDETLTGLEDIDWAEKFIQRGGKLVYDANAVIVHVHHESYDKIFNRYYREALAYKRIRPFAKFSIFDFITLFVTNSISDIYFAIKERKFFQFFLEILLFRFNQFYGTWKGYHFNGGVNAPLKERFYYPNNFLKKQSLETSVKERISY